MSLLRELRHAAEAKNDMLSLQARPYGRKPLDL